MAQRYPKEVKDQVLDAIRFELERKGEVIIAKVADSFSIPYDTVYTWARNAGLVGKPVLEQKKVELDALLEEKARMLLESMTDDDKKMRDKAIAIGILLDKKIGLQGSLFGQGIGASDWLAHVTITRTGKDSVDTGRPGEGESTPAADAAIPVSTTVGESNLPGSSGEGR